MNEREKREKGAYILSRSEIRRRSKGKTKEGLTHLLPKRSQDSQQRQTHFTYMLLRK